MKPPVLAFVHIEKAAGTTLIYLLRQHYALRYLDVRPLRAHSNGVFTAADLRFCLRLNPFLRAIGGHAVKPFSDLERVAPGVRYITVLRDPLQRYLSQYRYWIRVLEKNWTFEQFLDHEPSHDFQTRKLAGSANVAEARRMLSEQFFLVGVAERFDEFLLELQAKLRPEHFDPRYQRRNEADTGGSQVSDLLERYGARIRANNARDLEIYQYALNEILPRQRAAYPGDFDAAMEQFRRHNEHTRPPAVKLFADAAARKLYFEPATGIARRLRGLPMKGSY